jgi:hypothetical protein
MHHAPRFCSIPFAPEVVPIDSARAGVTGVAPLPCNPVQVVLVRCTAVQRAVLLVIEIVQRAVRSPVYPGVNQCSWSRTIKVSALGQESGLLDPISTIASPASHLPRPAIDCERGIAGMVERDEDLIGQHRKIAAYRCDTVAQRASGGGTHGPG